MIIKINYTLNEKELNTLKKQYENEIVAILNFENECILKTSKDIQIDEKYSATYFEDKELVFSTNEFKTTNSEFIESDLIIAGPCSVESYEQMREVVKFLKEQNITYIRGGLSKPRTSTYSFQGLDIEGIEIIKKLKEEFDFKFVSEVVSIKQIIDYQDVVDVFQVGTRNMQNYELLKELGKTNKPVILKRGMSATINEFLNAAEYIMANGNRKVILCERGIRTFESAYRNVLDINAIVYLKHHTHLPVIADPSHATGHYYMINDVSLAAYIAGADGIIVEVHNDPKNAVSDGPQSLNFDNFLKLKENMETVKNVRNNIYK